MRSIIFNSITAFLLNFTQLIGAEVGEVLDLADRKAGDPSDRKASKFDVANLAKLQTKSQLKKRVSKAKNSQAEMDQFVSEQAAHYYDLINNSGKFCCMNDARERQNVNSNLWEKRTHRMKSGYNVEYFTIAKCTNPEMAIIDLFEKGGIVDCIFILHLVQTRIAFDLYGKKYKGGCMLPELSKNLDVEVVPGYERDGAGIPMEPGSSGGIRNIDLYQILHPFGVIPNENVFCVGKSANGQALYVGYGKVFADGPITLEAVYQHLYEQTIVTPIGDLGDAVATASIEQLKEEGRKGHQGWDFWMGRSKEQGRSAVLKITLK